MQAIDASSFAAPALPPPAVAEGFASPYDLEHLSDSELFSATRGLIAGSNQLLAVLLAHLAEVEARGIHRLRACASLYTYCIYELRMSEDAAFRRAKAARFARAFPLLFECISRGELHLTGVLLLGPHLTLENHRDVLARAKHRTKRELLKLVRVLDPLPEVPARVEPLGPAPLVPLPGHATWEAFVTSMNPVRDLAPGERPADWPLPPSRTAPPLAPGAEHLEALQKSRETPLEPAGETDVEHGPIRPQRYKIQFTASQEYVDLLDRALDLLSHAPPHRSLEDAHLRAMRALVADLEKRKYASSTDNTESQREAPPCEEEEAPTKADEAQPGLAQTASSPMKTAVDPRRRGRSIPAAVRRAVRERDTERCTYVDARGSRCSETSRLEFHHIEPFARGGPSTHDNLTLRCRAHNQLAAEQDFGRQRRS